MPYRLTDLAEAYFVAKMAAGYSPMTTDRVRRAVMKLSREIKVNYLEDLTTDKILAWGDARREGKLGKPVSQSAIYADYNSIRSFLLYCEIAGYEHNVNRRMIYCKPNYRRRECLRPEEIRKIVHFAPYEVGVLIKLLFTGAMRLSEALELTLDDLNGDDTIYIQGKWCKPRTIHIYEDLRLELENLAKDGGYCFKDPHDPDKPLNRRLAYYYVKQAMIKAGFKHAYPHSLRHGAATTMLRNGANLSQVQHIMGHSHISTTQIYEHLVEDDIKAAHAKFMTRL